MNRFAIFAVPFPILALIVFVAPETISSGAVPSYFWDSMTFVYMPAMPVAMMAAGIDHLLVTQPLVVRVAVTSIVTGFVTAAFMSWLWGFLAGGFPLVMATLDGAIPAAVCSLAARFSTERA